MPFSLLKSLENSGQGRGHQNDWIKMGRYTVGLALLVCVDHGALKQEGLNEVSIDGRDP